MALFELTQDESDELKQAVLSFIYRVLKRKDMSAQEEATILPALVKMLTDNVSNDIWTIENPSLKDTPFEYKFIATRGA